MPDTRQHIFEPFLTAELEDSDGKLEPRVWTALALEELAKQLGIMNDYYYPLMGASGMLRAPLSE